MPVPDMVGFVVRDMAQSLKFYRLLGLDIPLGAETEDHVECKSNGYRIAWDTVELVQGFNPGYVHDTATHKMAMAFLCKNPAEVDAVFARLTEAGYSGKEPWDAFWGQRYATVYDPDGNGIDLFAPLG